MHYLPLIQQVSLGVLSPKHLCMVSKILIVCVYMILATQNNR